MKLNFWQILGILLVIGGAIGVMFFKEEKKPVIPATAPSTAPVAPTAS